MGLKLFPVLLQIQLFTLLVQASLKLLADLLQAFLALWFVRHQLFPHRRSRSPPCSLQSQPMCASPLAVPP